MRSRLLRIAFVVARVVFTARMRQACDDRDRDEASSVRAGQFIFASWLFSVWVVASKAAWLLLGRRPLWSAEQLLWPVS